MSDVLEKLRDGVEHVKRHLVPRHTRAQESLDDDLTEAERLDLLVRYRAKVGAKPTATEAHRLRSDVIREKLQPRPRPRPGV